MAASKNGAAMLFLGSLAGFASAVPVEQTVHGGGLTLLACATLKGLGLNLFCLACPVILLGNSVG